MYRYGYLNVGSGLFGATFAYCTKQIGKKSIVIDKRQRLGGNDYCESIGGSIGIPTEMEGSNTKHVHKYGAHIFHTLTKEVWDGEAQILGVPCLAGYVGGVKDMMKGAEDNLYIIEEVAMLAEKTVNVFDNADSQVLIVQGAKIRHDRTINADQLISIYKDIYKLESVI